MNIKVLIEELKDAIESKIYRTGNDGTRYYLLSRDELEEIIEALENK